MNILDDVDQILAEREETKEKEELYGYIWDNDVGAWTEACIYHKLYGTGHMFSLRVDGKVVLEERGAEFGPTMTTLLMRWEEKNAATDI